MDLVIKYGDTVAFVGHVDCDGKTLEFGESFPKLVKDVGDQEFTDVMNRIVGSFGLYATCRREPQRPKQGVGDKVDMFVNHFLLPGVAALMVHMATVGQTGQDQSDATFTPKEDQEREEGPEEVEDTE